MRPGAVPGEKATHSEYHHVQLRDPAVRYQQGVFCYTRIHPQGYGIDGLINKGYTGKGRNIVIIDAFGSPSIAADWRCSTRPSACRHARHSRSSPCRARPHSIRRTPTWWVGPVRSPWTRSGRMPSRLGPTSCSLAAKSDNDEDLLAALNYALDNRWAMSVHELR